MASIYVRCGEGVSSFVLHSASNSAYPRTITTTSWLLQTGFAAGSYDCYVDGVVYENDSYSGAMVSTYWEDGTTSDPWELSGDKYVATSDSQVRYVEVYATKPETETGYVLAENEIGIAGFAYTYYLNGESYSGSTELANKTLFGDVDTNITITSFSYADGYTSPVKFTEYTDSNRTTVKKYWYWPTDPKIYVNTGYRYIGFEATPKTYTLTYLPNGTNVSGMPESETAEYNTYLYVSNATPTRANHAFLGWSEDPDAVVPTFYGGAGIYMNANRTLYAIWEKNPIDKFYWNGSDTADADLIATGQPVTNITAYRWNSLLAKISELADAIGASFSYTTVSKGDGITAARFNVARNGLNNIKAQMGTSTRIPDAQESGNTMYAMLFNGSISLKSALNDMIEIYNSEYR